MANSINYAAVFNRILDEKFYILPRTAWMENTNPGIEWTGGREIKIPYIGMDGLGTMSGYKAPAGDLSLGYETKQLQWYRGRNFAIGRYDVDETNMALTVGNALNVFLKEHVAPEVDRLRIAYAAQTALGYGTSCVTAKTTSDITAANIFGLILADITKIQDKIGEGEQLYIQISTKLKGLLEQSSQLTHYMNTRDMSIRGVNTRVDTLNDQFLIGTPSSYMNTVVNIYDGTSSGQTVGGLVFDNLGADVNWIIAARPALDAVARPQITKVIDPDQNQDGEYWKIMFSIYHGIWGMDKKYDGILVNMDTSLGGLTVTSVAGTTAVGDSVITIAEQVPDGLKLMWKAASGTAPSVTAGTALNTTGGWAELDSGDTISTTNGYKLTVALCAASGLPVAYGTTTVVAKAS